MKNLFSLVINFANAIMWSVLLGIELYEEMALNIPVIVCGIFALINLITGLVYLSRYRKIRAQEKQAKIEKSANKNS